MEHYFKIYARQLQQLGYDPIPIGPRKKAIFDINWQTHDYSALITTPPLRKKGLSLRTVATPALDVDVTDAQIANDLVIWLAARGFKAFRYGSRPKFATMARWEHQPAPKQSSATYECGKIEILGDGQQLVAFNIHATTNEPYEWTEALPAVADLPVLTEQLVSDLFDYYEYLASNNHELIEGRASSSLSNIEQYPDDQNQLIAAKSSLPDELLPYIKKESRPGRYELSECIWSTNHSHNRKDGAFYAKDGIDGLPERYVCTHDSCKNKGMADVYEHFAFNIFDEIPAIAMDTFRLFELNREKVVVDRIAHDDFIPIADLLADQADPKWIIEGMIERNTVNVMFGASGSCKSFACLDMAMCVASGTDYAGMLTERGHVFYYPGEGAGGVPSRLQAWDKEYDKDTRDHFHMSAKPAKLNDKKHMHQLAQSMLKLAEARPGGLIIIDTLAASAGGLSTSDNDEVSLMFNMCNDIVDKLNNGSAFILVHHSGWAATQRERGASAIRGSADGTFSVERDADRITITCKKLRNGEDGGILNFGVKFVSFNRQTRSGKPIGSLVLLHEDEGMSPAEHFINVIDVPQGGSQALAVIELFDAGGKMCVLEWSAAVRGKMDALDPKKAFSKIKKKLLEHGHIEVAEGVAYLPKMRGLFPGVGD